MILFQTTVILPNHLTSKNNRPIYRRGGKPFIGKSAKHRVAETTLTRHLAHEYDGELITCDIAVKYLFYFDNKSSYSRVDLDNLLCLPNDCLQKANVIKNDNKIFSFDGSRKIYDGKCRLEITITEFLPE